MIWQSDRRRRFTLWPRPVPLTLIVSGSSSVTSLKLHQTRAKLSNTLLSDGRLWRLWRLCQFSGLWRTYFWVVLRNVWAEVHQTWWEHREHRMCSTLFVKDLRYLASFRNEDCSNMSGVKSWSQILHVSTPSPVKIIGELDEICQFKNVVRPMTESGVYIWSAAATADVW